MVSPSSLHQSALVSMSADVTAQAQCDAVAALQTAVLDALPSAARVEGSKVLLRLNPHLWRREDQWDVYHQPGAALGGPPSPAELRPWNMTWAGGEGWGGSVLKSFVERHPGLQASDLRLAYHGPKNDHRMADILFEGLDPKHKRSSCGRIPAGAYFGATLEDCGQYVDRWPADVVLFAIPKAACGTTRGDGAFMASEYDALPVGAYQFPTNWSFWNLCQGRPASEKLGIESIRKMLARAADTGHSH